MNRMPALFMMFAILLLSGCASPMRFENVTSQNTLEQDKFDCDTALRVVGMGSGSATQDLAYVTVRYRDDLRVCLERKGWRRIE